MYNIESELRLTKVPIRAALRTNAAKSQGRGGACGNSRASGENSNSV